MCSIDCGITNSLNIEISSKKILCSTVDLLSVVRIVLINILKKYTNVLTLQRF